MRSIFKYDVVNSTNGIIEGPITKLLCADGQHGSIKIWAEVDTTAPVRKFEVFPLGTGWPLDPPAGKECVLDTHAYLNTLQLVGGSLVFHVYYREIAPAPIKKTNPVAPKEKAEAKVADWNKSKEATFSGTLTMINPEILKVFTR